MPSKDASAYSERVRVVIPDTLPLRGDWYEQGAPDGGRPPDSSARWAHRAIGSGPLVADTRGYPRRSQGAPAASRMSRRCVSACGLTSREPRCMGRPARRTQREVASRARLVTAAVRQSRLAASQVAHHEHARPIDSDPAHGAESSTGHRWIQAKCLDHIDALADKHRIDRDLARRMAPEQADYDEAA